ncbi:MAG: NUDIX hydrolase [Anaerolineae bacterium]
MEAQGIEASLYKVVPRTLVFIRCRDRVLLIRRSPESRVMPGMLNGVGGHVEAGEGLAESARREVLEETGLHITGLRLVGLLHVTEVHQQEGVLVAVFTAQAQCDDGTPSAEGELRWVAADELGDLDLVPDLRQLLPLVTSDEPLEAFVASKAGDPVAPLRFSA